MGKERKAIIKSDACERQECFSYSNGHCLGLSDTDFGGKECPFYKRAGAKPGYRHTRGESAKAAEAKVSWRPVERPQPVKDKKEEAEPDFLLMNAAVMEEIGAINAEAEMIEKYGHDPGEGGTDDDVWEDS